MKDKIVIIDCDMNLFVKDIDGNIISQVHNDDIEELICEIKWLFGGNKNV